MSINVQLMQTLIQLQAMQSMNGSSSDSLWSTDGDDSFSSILTSLLAANPNLVTSVGKPSTNNIDMSALSNLNGIDTTLSGTDSKDYDTYINEAATLFNVNPKLIKSVIRHESSFNPNSVSGAGAIGLMQLMPGTARGLGVTDPFDPKQNILGGTKYLRQMLDTFNNDESLALAAYNAGPANVKKYDGIPPFQETQNYVRKVLQTYMA